VVAQPGLDRRSTALLDHLPFVTCIARVSDSKTLHVSASIERLLGITAGQALREPDFWSARLHPLDRDRVLAAWRSWTDGPGSEPFRCDYRMLGEQGNVVWVEDVTIFVAAEGDAPAAYHRHLLDVTRREQLEEQFRQLQRLELVGRLVSGVAHDFNNLLAVIVGYSERLKSQPPGPMREEGLDAIGAAAQRGTSLVRHLLAYARPQAAEQRLADLNCLVAELAPLLRRVIGEDVELELRLDPGPLPVEIHPVQADQILMNLAVNARDAMPNGGRLTIATSREATAENDIALLTVSDTGHGMEPETRSRIFEPFFSTKSPADGSGLGLATTAGIVGRAGGSIGAESVPGEGSTFSIRFPLSSSDETSVEEPASAPVQPAGGSEVVLVVEDDPALRELERVVLEEAGYHVLAAGSGTEALLAVGARRPDVVVVDMVLPGMSGPQLVEELAARGCDVPIIFVSGYGSEELASRGIGGPKAAVIDKPFQSEILLAKVRDLLDASDEAESPLSRSDDPPREDPDETDFARRRATFYATLGGDLANGHKLLAVRCLACKTPYRQADRHDLVARGGCPRCGYAGWTIAD
jgi:signal transduction histidine kinase/ActR/RegA family two-component response regulator